MVKVNDSSDKIHKNSKIRVLGTVLLFATAHRFCASRDGPRRSDFLRTVPTNSVVFFCVAYRYAGKEDLSKCY